MTEDKIGIYPLDHLAFTAMPLNKMENFRHCVVCIFMIIVMYHVAGDPIANLLAACVSGSY